MGQRPSGEPKGEPMTEGASDSVCKASSVGVGMVAGVWCYYVARIEGGQPCDEGWIKVV